eukprot:196445-Rhodomonas_salina.2
MPCPVLTWRICRYVRYATRGSTTASLPMQCAVLALSTYRALHTMRGTDIRCAVLIYMGWYQPSHLWAGFARQSRP